MTTLDAASNDPTAFEQQKPLGLIDVDCNLWHSDFQELVSSVTSKADLHPSDAPSFFDILQHDDVRHIRAMVSPSSTVAEAVRGVQALRERNQGMTEQQSQDAVRILTTVGVHPYHVNDDVSNDTSQHIQEQMQVARNLLQQSSSGTNRNAHCCAIGECGLDGSEGFPSMNDQIPWFVAQLELAAELQSYPLFVHERLAFDETLALLTRHIPHDSVETESNHDAPSSALVRYRPRIPILIHCFTGTVAECRTYLEHGYSISLSGHVFRSHAHDVRQCLIDGILPLDKLMIETDAPYMGFSTCRDLFVAHNAAHVATLKAKERKRLVSSQRPNPPSALVAVATELVSCLNQGREARGEALVTVHELARWTSRNANAFFGFGLDL